MDYEVGRGEMRKAVPKSYENIRQGFAQSSSGIHYPQLGSSTRITVTKYGFNLEMYLANGDFRESFWAVETPEDVALLVNKWCSGKRPTR